MWIPILSIIEIDSDDEAIQQSDGYVSECLVMDAGSLISACYKSHWEAYYNVLSIRLPIGTTHLVWWVQQGAIRFFS